MLTLWCQHSDTIAILERELLFMRTQFQHERQRAERAVDELLRLKAQAQAISGPLLMPESDLTATLQRALHDPEFARAGEAE